MLYSSCHFTGASIVLSSGYFVEAFRKSLPRAKAMLVPPGAELRLYGDLVARRSVCTLSLLSIVVVAHKVLARLQTTLASIRVMAASPSLRSHSCQHS